MKKTILIGATVLALVVFISFKFNKNFLTTNLQSITPAADNSVVPSRLTKIINSPQGLANRAQLIEKIGQSPNNAISVQSHLLFEIESNIDRTYLEDRFWDQILSNPQVLPQAKLILSDFKKTLTDFPKDQAYVRLFAIKALQAAAIRGKSEDLDSTISTLLANRRSDPTEFQEHGRLQDISDLMAAWFTKSGDKILSSAPESFFESFFPSGPPTLEERELILRGLQNSLPGKFHDSAFVARFYRRLKGEG